MKTTTHGLFNNLINNYYLAKSCNRWEYGLVNHLVALTYTINNNNFNGSEFLEISNYIKKNTGVFSYFRGNTRYMLSSLLINDYDKPKEAFDKTLKVYDQMKKNGFKNCENLPMAVYALMKISNDNYDIYVNLAKTMDIFNEMKANHPWITSRDDYPMAVLLSILDIETEACINNIEEAYNELKDQKFSQGNGLQMLSQILAFSQESTSEKVSRCVKIHNKLKENKIKVYSSSYPILGFIALLGDSYLNLIDDLLEIINLLKKDNKYKWFQNEVLLSTAAAIISAAYLQDINDNNEIVKTSLSISFETLIAAQTAAIIAAISCTSTAA